jgi:hypothetical protein
MNRGGLGSFASLVLEMPERFRRDGIITLTFRNQVE